VHCVKQRDQNDDAKAQPRDPLHLPKSALKAAVLFQL